MLLFLLSVVSVINSQPGLHESTRKGVSTAAFKKEGKQEAVKEPSSYFPLIRHGAHGKRRSWEADAAG